jgi:hypothetical protein
VNRPLRLGRTSRLLRRSSENVIGSYGSADALEFKLANGFDRDGVLDLHQHTRVDKN